MSDRSESPGSKERTPEPKKLNPEAPEFTPSPIVDSLCQNAKKIQNTFEKQQKDDKQKTKANLAQSKNEIFYGGELY